MIWEAKGNQNLISLHLLTRLRNTRLTKTSNANYVRSNVRSLDSMMEERRETRDSSFNSNR